MARDEELTWRKASRSSSEKDECVEVALRSSDAYVRDSKHVEAGRLRFQPSTWQGFIGAAKAHGLK